MAILNMIRELSSIQSTTLLLAIAAVSFISYGAALAIYRLYLSPLAKFPGPKLAALTQYYETYYELMAGGMFTHQIKKMHDRFGMLIIFTECCSHVWMVRLFALILLSFTSTIRNITKPYMPHHSLTT